MPTEFVDAVVIFSFISVMSGIAIDCRRIYSNHYKVCSVNILTNVKFWITLDVAGPNVYLEGTKVPREIVNQS